jgi:hypothetical protein
MMLKKTCVPKRKEAEFLNSYSYPEQHKGDQITAYFMQGSLHTEWPGKVRYVYTVLSEISERKKKLPLPKPTLMYKDKIEAIVK